MWNIVSNYYLSHGPLGAWTPAVVLILNILGIAIALAVSKVFSSLFTPSYDLLKIPAPPLGDPILGHVKFLLRLDYHRVILEWTRKYGSIFRLRLLTNWIVVITDPAVAAQVLASVPGRSRNYTLIDEVLGGPGKLSFFGTQDEVHWRNVRKTTAPAFSMANVRRYFGGVLSAASELLSSLDLEQAALGYVDMEPHLQRMMLRATLEGLFEVPDARALPGFDLLVPRILMLMSESNRQIVDPLRALWYRTPLAPLMSKHVAACRVATREVTAFHTATAAQLLSRADPSPDNTLLWACLHRLRHPIGRHRLTPEQLRPEVGVYTTAGFDTTASTMGWCLYAAALYPEQQERVAAELRKKAVFGSGAVIEAEGDQRGSWAGAAGIGGGGGGGGGGGVRLNPRVCPSPEELARLPLLNAFINETMRLYPTAAVAPERVTGDQPVTVGCYTLPPKALVWPLVYGIHMSDRNWDEPDEFRMDRWLEDSECAFARRGAAIPPVAGQRLGEKTRQQQQQEPPPQQQPAQKITEDADLGPPPPRRFMPFADGPKNCVGQNFATVVVRAVFALLLSRYRVALHPDMGLGISVEGKGGGVDGFEGAGTGDSGFGDSGGASASQLAGFTATLTLVAVVTKLTKLRLVLSRRD